MIEVGTRLLLLGFLITDLGYGKLVFEVSTHCSERGGGCFWIQQCICEFLAKSHLVLVKVLGLLNFYWFLNSHKIKSWL